MATLTSNISNVSLTVSGTTQQSTTISWSLPTVPSGATISSCTLTGTATASMSKGSATITVNGQTVYSGSDFTINLGTGNTTSSVTATAQGGNKNAAGTVTFSNLVYTVNYTEPVVIYTVTFVDHDGTVLKIEEVGSGSFATAPIVNRFGYVLTGWSVDFSNVTSNITTTAQYKAVHVLSIKENGNWINIEKIYKKVSDVWIEQPNVSWTELFNTNFYYKKNELPIIINATLYSDGTLVFANHSNIDNSYGNVVAKYSNIENANFSMDNIAPWQMSTGGVYVKQAYFDNLIANNTVYWLYLCTNLTTVYGSLMGVTNMSRTFSDCQRLTSLDLSSFSTSNVTDMSYMFSRCYILTTLDLSNFDTSNVTNMNSMFRSCEALTLLDLSNFDMTKVSSTSNMFYGCTNLQTVYVKDETAKTKIEASSGFPTTATVIIGSPA